MTQVDGEMRSWQENNGRWQEKTSGREYFNEQAPVYMNNSFTQNTVKEVDFILEELKLPLGSRILDVGC